MQFYYNYLASLNNILGLIKLNKKSHILYYILKKPEIKIW